jgi:hypothetical protein
MTWRVIFARPYRTITVDGGVSTLAGDGTAGYRDGPGAAARFNQPAGVAVHASGTVLVSEYNNNRVRMITPEVGPDQIFLWNFLDHNSEFPSILPVIPEIFQKMSKIMPENAGINALKR